MKKDLGLTEADNHVIYKIEARGVSFVVFEDGRALYRNADGAQELSRDHGRFILRRAYEDQERSAATSIISFPWKDAVQLNSTNDIISTRKCSSDLTLLACPICVALVSLNTGTS